MQGCAKKIKGIIRKQVDILISTSQALQVLYLKYNDNVYKTS